ncbi:hypothetical protein [Comamonas resistens]|uniref:Uncharacterized protein n=1 Tax=Comamonas resistens TaxID=3046670 RepID=A0ABY8SYC1_9BURK|nr:hypothetical protein [Comamonas resistens]MDL5039014.1 hypothetical protein [Comamonas resistens]WHS68054.1 hypothetical protein QMY55_14975 [Comamonas resistens]
MKAALGVRFLAAGAAAGAAAVAFFAVAILLIPNWVVDLSPAKYSCNPLAEPDANGKKSLFQASRLFFCLDLLRIGP